MKTIYKVILLNFASVIGCVGTVILVAPETSRGMCAVLCLVTLLVMNGTFFYRLRNRTSRAVGETAPRSTTGRVIFVWAIFLLSLAAVWMERHWVH